MNKNKLKLVKLATVVEGDPKAPFSSRVIGEGATPFSGLLHFTLDMYLSVKQGGIFWVLRKEVSSTILKIFRMSRPGIEPRSPGPLTNILPTMPMNRFLIRILGTMAVKKCYRPNRWNETQFLPDSGCIDTAIWMHYMDAN